MKLSASSFISNLSSKKRKSKKSRSVSRLDARSCDSTTSSSSDESSSYQLQSSLHDVKISRHELEAVLRRLCTDPPTDEELSAIVAAEGIDGCITMAELGKICESDGEEELREAFDVFDVNGDGKISAEELLEVFLAMGDACTIEDCKRMIGGVDSDGDGLVSFRDFLKMMEVQR
jgi:calcium-binding protein CML